MYGISNSQQQGGGGGGAASYTKIESKIAKTAWTDNMPSWIGQNALTWSVTIGTYATPDGTEEYATYAIQGGTEDLGLVEGSSYTTIMTIDGTDYEEYSEVFSSGGHVGYLASFNNHAVVMKIIDHCAGFDENRPISGNGYFVMVGVMEGTPSSVIIKSCSAASGGEAIINNSAIKTNSAVTMYVDYNGKMSAVKKIDGSLTVSVSTMPSVDISYAIEIVDTNVEGLFEVINNNFPWIPEIPASLPQTTSDFTEVSVRPSQWTKGTYTDGSNFYYYDFNVENMYYTDALFKVNYADYIEICEQSSSGSTGGPDTMRVTVKKLPTEDLYIIYRLGKISGYGNFGTNITVVNEFSGYITDKPDHLYLTDTATGTLYEITVANGTISLVAQSST